MLVDNVIVGWVDFDTDRDWLGPGEINVGYNVFAEFRGRGFATRGVLLLLQSLEESGEFHTATVSIAAGNDASLAVASKAGFEVVASTPDGWRLSRPIRLVSTN
jgi:RimJ/RimL family protein N-acetyltransferase